MTREEFISKLPDLNMKDAVIRLVDQGVDVYGFQTEEKIGKWYEDCSNLLAESSGFLPVFTLFEGSPPPVGIIIDMRGFRKPHHGLHKSSL